MRAHDRLQQRRPSDVTSQGWFHDIPADRPTLIIAEGLTPYLEPSKGKRLFRDLVEYFGTSTDKEVRQNHIIFDTLGSLSVRLTSYIPALRSSRSAFRWGIDDPREVEDTHPRLQLVDRILWKEYMDLHPPFFGRYGTMAASVLPLFKKNIQFWRFRF
jgi:O-methyltransferase involved in polyketide biosynthesis